VTIVHSLHDALQAAGDAPEIMVIGGAQLYTSSLPRSDRLYLTQIQANLAGDTFFPEVDWAQWRLIRRSATQSGDGVSFFFAVFDRIAKPAQN
jgi:dihydrofolate reductase